MIERRELWMDDADAQRLLAALQPGDSIVLAKIPVGATILPLGQWPTPSNGKVCICAYTVEVPGDVEYTVDVVFGGS